MKTFFRLLLSLIVLLVLSVVIFYFWAKRPLLSEAEYTVVATQQTLVTPPVSDSTFTLVTYNIGYLSGMTNNQAIETDQAFYQKNMEQVIATFQAQQPDLIAFQEIDFGADRSYQVDQLRTLAEALGMAHMAKAINWDKRYVPFPYFPPSAHFGRVLSGQGILSRFPLANHERIVLERVPSNTFYYDAFYLDRLAEVCQTEIQGKTITIINVHLEAFDKPTRKRQTDFVRGLYAEYAKANPTILLGDFNSELAEEDATIRSILQLPNVVAACPPSQLDSPEAFTYASGDPQQQIDYIFYDSTQLSVQHWDVLQEMETPSDHLPVLAIFRWKE